MVCACGEREFAQAPHGLMVEFLRTPENILIKDNQPEYSWIVPKEAISQSAYQILVASSKENISNKYD